MKVLGSHVTCVTGPKIVLDLYISPSIPKYLQRFQRTLLSLAKQNVRPQGVSEDATT